jgi:hypothetical protein
MVFIARITAGVCIVKKSRNGKIRYWIRLGVSKTRRLLYHLAKAEW